MGAEPDSLTRDGAPDPRIWSPLREGAFRAVWLAAVLSICVVWMQDVGSAWLMKRLTDGDPLMVGLVQAMAVLPVVLLALPAGTLGDLVDRRGFLLWALVWLAVTSALLAAMTRADAITPASLLALTVATGVSKAMILPGFAAACAELASKPQLHNAVGLHSMANNAGRIVGPAIAGIALALTGVWALYAAAVAGATLSALLLLSAPAGAFGRPRRTSESFAGAMRSGLDHCLADPAFRGVAARTGVFFVGAVATHALLPLLMEDAHWFGIGWAMYGAGAVGAALLFPLLSARLSPSGQLTLGIAVHAVLLLALAAMPGDTSRTVALAGLGAAWYLVISAGQLAVQRALPDAIRARGLALFTMLLMTGFLVGAPLWGALARRLGAEGTLALVAVMSLFALLGTHRRPLARVP
jgi:MFS family permease